MKRIIAFLLVFVVLFCFSSCDFNDKKSESEKSDSKKTYEFIKTEDVSNIIIDSFPSSDSYYRNYTSKEKIKLIAEYINNLKLEPIASETMNSYAGQTLTIFVIYKDGTTNMFYHCYNLYFLDNDENCFKIDKEQAQQFSKLIENNPSDSVGDDEINSDFVPEPDENSELEFWITQPVTSADFEEHDEIYGWFGANEFYGLGYHPEVNENGAAVKPKYYVTYLLTSYPDYSDFNLCVTRIAITDPAVNVYGLNTNSTIGEFKNVFEGLGYTVTYELTSSMTRCVAKQGKISFIFTQFNSDEPNELTISAEVTNKEGIIF